MGSMSVSRKVWAIHYGAKQQPDGSWLHDDGDVYWFNDEGDVHRADGPAIIRNGHMYWSLNDREYSLEDWLKRTPISDEDKMMLRLQYG
jgi:hypothetical protein